jgi:CMP-N,N'-diacetyllegionaminic acid synthase
MIANDERSALAVIIGRAGSKGLPGKNAKPIAGQPMICHSIDDAKAARCVGRIIVSTDGDRIAQAAARMDVEVIRRPAELATDTATVDSAVRHAVERSGAPHQHIIILYANVPVRPGDLIDRAFDLLVTSGADSVQSYADVGKHHPWWMVTLDERSRVTHHHPNAIYRRQDLPRLLIPDGGVIALTRQSLMRVVDGAPHAFLGDDRRGIEASAGDVIDVDSPIDFAVAEAILKAQGEVVRA